MGHAARPTSPSGEVAFCETFQCSRHLVAEVQQNGFAPEARTNHTCMNLRCLLCNYWLEVVFFSSIELIVYVRQLAHSCYLAHTFDLTILRAHDDPGTC